MSTYSIIIPSYQAAKTLGRALRSALSQTHAPHEIVVCDDGSSDGTSTVLAEFERDITIVRQDNLGLSAARNSALAATSGTWIVLLDADDELLPGKVAGIEAKRADDPGADIITTDAWVRGAGRPDSRWYEDRSWPSGDQKVAIIEENFVFASSAVRRTSLEQVGGFTTGLAHDSEYDTWVRIILAGGRAALVAEPLSVYHRSDRQLSHQRISNYEMILQILSREEHRHGETVDMAIRERRLETNRLLSIAHGVDAVRNGDRRGCWRAAQDPHIPPILRLRFAGAAVAMRTAGRVLRQPSR